MPSILVGPLMRGLAISVGPLVYVDSGTGLPGGEKPAAYFSAQVDYRSAKLQKAYQDAGEALRYRWDFDDLIAATGAAVESVLWLALTGEATISHISTLSHCTSAVIDTPEIDEVHIKLTVNMDNGERVIEHVMIRVREYS